MLSQVPGMWKRKKTEYTPSEWSWYVLETGGEKVSKGQNKCGYRDWKMIVFWREWSYICQNRNNNRDVSLSMSRLWSVPIDSRGLCWRMDQGLCQWCRGRGRLSDTAVWCCIPCESLLLSQNVSWPMTYEAVTPLVAWVTGPTKTWTEQSNGPTLGFCKRAERTHSHALHSAEHIFSLLSVTSQWSSHVQNWFQTPGKHKS